MTQSRESDYVEPTADVKGPPKGALLTIFLIVFTDFLGFGIIIPLLPFYIPGYERAGTEVGTAMKVTALFSIFSVCQFLGAPILGALSDRVGRKPVLGFSQIGSAVGYLLLAVATHYLGTSPSTALALVYLSRIIDGFTGGNVSTAQAYISDVTTAENRAKGMGLLGAAFGIGFSAGPAIGGILGHYNPAYPAYLAAAFSVAAAVMSFVLLPESRTHKPTDVQAWLHPSQFTPVLRRPVVVQLLGIGFASMAAFVMMESVIALFLNKPSTFSFSQKQLGYFFAFMGVIIIIVQGRLIGKLTQRHGEWPLAILGPVAVAVGMALFTAIGYGANMLWLLALAGAFNATGRSLQQPTLSSLLSKHADPNEQGVTFGLYHGLSSIARVVGPVIAGFAYPHLHNTGPFLVAAIIVLATAAWTMTLRTKAESVASAATPSA